MFTDTHCHITLKDNINDIIKNAKNNKILKIINNGCDYKSNEEVLKIHQEYTNIYSAIGFHPQNIENFNIKDLNQIVDNIDNIVAIGEIGLDYYNGHKNHEYQKKIFIKQLEIAEKYSKPVIVHSRNATNDTIEILKMFPKVKGSIHCFTGSVETAKEYVKMGYKLGINGVLTFKNSNLYQIIERIELENIILETDSPYLTPEPYRGQKNEPSNIIHIAKKICETKNITLDELSKITEKTVSMLFDI